MPQLPVEIKHARLLSREQRDKMYTPLGTYLVQHGVYQEPETIENLFGAGQVFAVLVGERVVGCIYVRVWPNNMDEGDVHIICAERRMLDYRSVIAFMAFLKGRGEVMALKRWRVAVEPKNRIVHRALSILGFTDTGIHPFPIMGVARIMTREVK